ncbi:MAG TPA: bifunctional adenosylcobinamide kinase/adenosylcobinamide-phosphate guanylyltransferase, partial [Ignavibacteriales bacterium]|nr:bifunctional adenosylcobinamide kinase/adenosylcobinamide-phosphate guanylyltransferase [Ignavibacteriales bacterium]
MIYYVSGGERSGKSTFAQKLALQLSNNPYYLATARILDKDIQKRVVKHKQDRDERWQTVEIDVHLSSFDYTDITVVVDCVTLWLTNIFFDNNEDLEKSLQIAKNEINSLKIS